MKRTSPELRTSNSEQPSWFSRLFSFRRPVPFFLLALSGLLLLTHCGKSQIVKKPALPATPQKETLFAEQRIIEINGRRITPLVPTVFLLPDEPLTLRTRPAASALRESPGLKASGTSTGSGRYQTVGYQPAGDQSQELPDPDGEQCAVALDGRPLARSRNNLFVGSAPGTPGLYKLEIAFKNKWRPTALTRGIPDGGAPESSGFSLLIIVLNPYAKLENGFIDQFPMGFYPDPQEPLLKIISKELQPLYRPPQGFIAVTPENQGTYVSRHFRLQDLDCRLKAPFPHYMALSSDLLLKLESLTFKVQNFWGPEARLNIHSGYRTPWHNLAVSGALWSRHIYGDAADISLAKPQNKGPRADLNPEGPMDQGDIKMLARMIEEVEKETGLIGGLGLYDWGENGRQNPFIHLDCRGVKARW
jgi:hypothetical protein